MKYITERLQEIRTVLRQNLAKESFFDASFEEFAELKVRMLLKSAGKNCKNYLCYR